MGNSNINIDIISYADDAVLIEDCEDDLQRQLRPFNVTARSYNRRLTMEKKVLTIAKQPIPCKLDSII